ncbi:MAG: hypothetical protein GEU97_07335 [Actinophytocola sp.]|nr:hypothetical protein [Actinophytocola sp.]
MADNWEETADAVNRAVIGAVKSLEDVFEKERTVYGGATWVEGMLSSVGVGKGFRFPSVEDANKIINSFKDRQRSIENRQDLISQARDVLGQPFADDDASMGYIKKALDSLERLAELNDSALNYVDHYIGKLDAAKQAKHAEDESMAQGFGKSGRAIG